MVPHFSIIPINKYTFEPVHKKKNEELLVNSNDILKHMMNYDRLTLQTSKNKQFLLFDEHLYKLNFSLKNFNISTLQYFGWMISNDEFQESTLVENKSCINEMNSSLEINGCQQKSLKKKCLLEVFTFDSTIKKKVAKLEKIIRKYNLSGGLNPYQFKNVINMIAHDLWTKLSLTWLEWYNRQNRRKMNKFTLKKNNFKLLGATFRDQFYQNYFFIRRSDECSLSKFSSVVEHFHTTPKGNKNIKTLLASQRSTEIRTFGIWLDLDNGIIMFANSKISPLIKFQDYTSLSVGYCISNISPELLTKKIVLFLNLSLLEFFKSQAY